MAMKRAVLLVTTLFLAAASAGLAATAPTAGTSPATSVTSSSATLNGSVNPNGTSTSWYFEFGTSTNYGSKTTVEDAGSGTTALNVAVPIVGLQANKAYHYRLVASSSGGASQGADQALSTGNATAVTTSSATSIGSTTAKLSGSVNPNGQPTSWYFQYGPTTSYGSTTSVQNAGSGTHSKNVSSSISGLTPGGAYHFQLVATYPTGPSYGGDQSFTTTGPPGVTTSAAQGMTASGATLNGSVDPKGLATSWHFDYGTTSSYGAQTPSQAIGSTAGVQAVSATLSGLTPGTTYHYRLDASSSAGPSLGADLTLLTPPSVILDQPVQRVVFGNYVRLSGKVSSGQAGITVTVLAEKFGATSFSQISTVLTGSGGGWTYLAKPGIATMYQVSANGGSSSTTTIGVQPAVSLQLITGGRFASRVFSELSLTGRVVQLRHLVGTRWATITRARLNPGAIFAVGVLPRGISQIRVALSVNQAGPGYLGGFSRTLTYSRG